MLPPLVDLFARLSALLEVRLARGACCGSCDWCVLGGAGVLPPVGVLGIGIVVGGARSLPPMVGVVIFCAWRGARALPLRLWFGVFRQF